MTRLLRLAKEASMDFMAAFHPDREWWIVGGALRDTDLGQRFKDVDIFINGYDTDLLPEGEVDLGDRNAFLLRAYTVKDYLYKGERFEINLIFMRGDHWNLESMTDRCDFGICQIGWDPTNNRTYRSSLYLSDHHDKTLTLARETSRERKSRMENKFSDFAFRNPEYIELDGDRMWVYSEESGELEVKYDKYIPRDRIGNSFGR